MKIILQHFWTLTLEWDQEPPEDIVKEWTTIQNQMLCINQLKVRRYTCINDSLLLVGFCDASQNAYGAVLYAHYKNEEEKYESDIIYAKTKVAPLSDKQFQD